MVIIDNRARITAKFKDIKSGECFFDDEGQVLMKIEEQNEANAVYLTNGYAVDFEDCAEVHPVQTEVIIH